MTMINKPALLTVINKLPLRRDNPTPSQAAVQAIYRQEGFWRGAARTRAEMAETNLPKTDDMDPQFDVHHQGAARVDRILQCAKMKMDPSWLPAFKAWRAFPQAWVKK